MFVGRKDRVSRLNYLSSYFYPLYKPWVNLLRSDIQYISGYMIRKRVGAFNRRIGSAMYVTFYQGKYLLTEGSTYH